MYEAMTTLYAIRVLEGRTLIENVPEKLRDAVKARAEYLDTHRDENGRLVY